MYAGDGIINGTLKWLSRSIAPHSDMKLLGTMFVALTDANLPLTPFNLSMINPHVDALGLHVAG